MEMKKRVTLELKNRNPAEVCNVNYNSADFNLFSEEIGEGCRLERNDDAENIQREQTSSFLLRLCKNDLFRHFDSENNFTEAPTWRKLLRSIPEEPAACRFSLARPQSPRPLVGTPRSFARASC